MANSVQRLCGPAAHIAGAKAAAIAAIPVRATARGSGNLRLFGFRLHHGTQTPRSKIWGRKAEDCGPHDGSEQLAAIREKGTAAELEWFADLLQIAIINFEDAGRRDELTYGTFCTQMQQKLSAMLLTDCFRW